MSTHRFESGKTTLLSTAPAAAASKLAIPYDDTLRFNKVVERKGKDPVDLTYSIDAEAILDVIDTGDLADLYKITLVGRPARHGIGVWDTLFNSSDRHKVSACVFMAQHDFSPILPDRVIVNSQFLNFQMAVSRVYLNQVIVGDRVGIAIHDIPSKLVYVLLYVVDGLTSVNPITDESVGLDQTSKPAVNVRMEHALMIPYDGVASFVNMEEGNDYDADKAKAFVEHLNDTVYDIGESYPWKPHFVPVIYNVKRDVIEERLKKDHQAATPITLSDFEKRCKKAYRLARTKHKDLNSPDNVRRRPKAKPTKGKEFSIPAIEVVSKGDQYFIKFDSDVDPTGAVFYLSHEEFDKWNSREWFFTNRDLASVNVESSRYVTVLRPAVFGPDAYLRYFSLNF